MKVKSLAAGVLVGMVFCFISSAWSVPIKPVLFYSKTEKGMGNRSYTLRFSLWDAETGGNKVWEEEKVLKTKGSVISTYLGEANSLEGVNFGQALWVQVEKKQAEGTYVQVGEMDELIGVPYAMWALTPLGPQGPEGPKGDKGDKGEAGPQGAKGDTGSTGPMGPQGLQGAMGAAGPQGPIGLTGPQGATGPVGPTGATGTSFNWVGPWVAGSYVDNDVVEFNGSSYAATADTSAGPPNAPWDLMAQMGATGPTGPTGATGATGPTGPQGPAGATGATGAAGHSPVLTWSADQIAIDGTVASPHLTGPQGLLLPGSAAGDTPYWDGSQWVTNNSNIFNPGGNVGIGTTNPRARLEVGGTDGLLVTGAVNQGTVRALGAGVRMHWYPRKGAFRVGMAETNWWDDDGTSYPHLALYSIGMGYQPRASGVASVAIGAYNRATGDYGLALGSYSQATASHSVAIGTQVFATGIYSIAMGSGADTNGHDGAMVIGDDAYFQTAYATNDNQITMRFIGGESGTTDSNENGDGGGRKAYRFFTSYPGATAGVYMNARASGWANYSSRKLKENFRPLDGEWLLEKIRNMSVTEWNYKATPETKYIGPVAEEFWDAFHLNGDDQEGINSISIDGVNMAGVQALEKRTREMKAQIDLLQAEKERLKAQIIDLNQLKEQLAELKHLKAEVTDLLRKTEADYAHEKYSRNRH